MSKHIFYYIRCVAFCPKELLKIKRIHIIVGFITNTIAFYSLIVNAQKRTWANHIKSSINTEKFKRCCNFGMLLDFIKKQQSLSGDEFVRWINQGYTLYYSLGTIAIRCNLFIFFGCYKVNLNNTFIVLFRELFNRFGFTNLSRPFYYKRLSIIAIFPLQ